MNLRPGARLGPYEILSPLGAGGMGEAWKAKDTRLDREVAIKILPAGLAQNEQFRARFEREAKVISSLNHPNICTLHDVGEIRPARSWPGPSSVLTANASWR
jgi:eukaryotic-like serine/threonine-protein kinase